MTMLDDLPSPDDIEALFFDLDDTLIDARGAWRAGFAEVVTPLFEETETLQALGQPDEVYEAVFRPYSEQAFRDRGGGEWSPDFTRTAFGRLLAEHAAADDALADRLTEAYVEAWPRHIAMFHDAIDTLRAAAGRYRLGLITNGPSREQRLKIEICDLEDHFEVIAVSAEVGALKPDAAIFQHALDGMAVSPGRAVHVGDSAHHDVRGARGAGLGAVWVDRGRGAPRDEHEEPHAAVRSLGELRALLELDEEPAAEVSSG